MNSLKEYLSHLKNWITIFFVAVPLASSIISAFHIYEFLKLGNVIWVSITGALIFEIANIAIIFALVVMKKLNPVYVWITFSLLVILQYLGNIYYSYNYIHEALQTSNSFLISFVELLHIEANNKVANFILALLLGIPFPTLSILLSKSLVDYLDQTEEEVNSNLIVQYEERLSQLENKRENDIQEIYDIIKSEDTNLEEQIQEIKKNLDKYLIKKDTYTITEVESGKSHKIKLS